MWRPPACGCPACFPRPWPGTAARGCPAAWGTSGPGQGLLGWGVSGCLFLNPLPSPAGPATADHSASPSCSHSQDDRRLVSESSRPCWQSSTGPCQEPQDGRGARGGTPSLAPILYKWTPESAELRPQEGQNRACSRPGALPHPAPSSGMPPLRLQLRVWSQMRWGPGSPAPVPKQLPCEARSQEAVPSPGARQAAKCRARVPRGGGDSREVRR